MKYPLPLKKPVAKATAQENTATWENKEDDSTAAWLYDEGIGAPQFTMETRPYTMSVVKKVYPTASSALGSRVQHWAIVLKPLGTAEEILFEFSPYGVVMNNDGSSAHEAYLEEGAEPVCTDLGKTTKTIKEIKAWIFSKYKVYRDENYDGFPAQNSDVMAYSVVSNNCQSFAMSLADYLRTPISTHSQATEVLGSIGAVCGLALAGLHAPIVGGAAAVLAGAAAFGVFENVTEHAGIASIGDGMQKIVNGVDTALGGAPRLMVKGSCQVAMTGAGAAVALAAASPIRATTKTPRHYRHDLLASFEDQ